MKVWTMALAVTLSLLVATGSPSPVRAQEGEEGSVPLPPPRPDFGSDDAPTPPADAPEESIEDEAPESIATLARVYQAACPAVISGRVIATRVEPIETEEGCGLQSPWMVEAIAVASRTLPLSGTPTMSCGMATALADWAEASDAGARALLESPIASLSTGPGYTCRLRNNADEGFISEHGLGNAADILGFSLEDGRTVDVLSDWDRESEAPEARFLEFAHARACTGFTTVLGPEANAAHENHFHFDLGCHGQSCTARICQ